MSASADKMDEDVGESEASRQDRCGQYCLSHTSDISDCSTVDQLLLGILCAVNVMIIENIVVKETLVPAGWNCLMNHLQYVCARHNQEFILGMFTPIFSCLSLLSFFLSFLCLSFFRAIFCFPSLWYKWSSPLIQLGSGGALLAVSSLTGVQGRALAASALLLYLESRECVWWLQISFCFYCAKLKTEAKGVFFWNLCNNFL